MLSNFFSKSLFKQNLSALNHISKYSFTTGKKKVVCALYVYINYIIY